MDSEYLFKPIEDENKRKEIAKLPQREYICGNKNHFVFTTVEDDAVKCELCGKIYTYDECNVVNKKTGKSWGKIPNQPLTNKAK